MYLKASAVPSLRLFIYFKPLHNFCGKLCLSSEGSKLLILVPNSQVKMYLCQSCES